MLSFRIALRYLFSRTRLHAVNYVTALSAVAIAVVAMALVAVVGVYNGYVAMILGATKQVDADIVLRDTEGGVFDLKKFPDYPHQAHEGRCRSDCPAPGEQGTPTCRGAAVGRGCRRCGLGLCLRLPDGACS